MKKPPKIFYRVGAKELHAHLFQIDIFVAEPKANQVLALPTWIPGSYLIREFSKNLQKLKAYQEDRAVVLSQIDKSTWQVTCDENQGLYLSYEVYALDNSVRTAWLDANRGFFNGTSLFLQVLGQEDTPQALELVQCIGMEAWSVATGLTAVSTNTKGFGAYIADNYDELVDCPVEMGDFWRGSFTSCGIPHEFVVYGASSGFDGNKLLTDTSKICETALRFWHPRPSNLINTAPHKKYVFMLNAVDSGYGGLEHRNSTALICNRKDLPQLTNVNGLTQDFKEGYTTLLGLISHEYFHTWNVKKLRPSNFKKYDYSRENYTELLWFFEGFTSYFDDLLLYRSGLIDETSYLKLLNKTISQVLQTPGRLVQSVAQSSNDAWIKYYRQDENTPNSTVSYYTKGALVGLCLDLTLRQEGKINLDDVMRSLWTKSNGGPMTERDLSQVLMDLTGRSYAKEIKRWVHSTAELPVEELLNKQGVSVLHEPAQLMQRLGLRVKEDQGIRVTNVFSSGAAELAGFAPGDEWLGVEVGQGKAKAVWRLSKLNDFVIFVGLSTRVTAWVSRDKRILSLQLKIPKHIDTIRLEQRDLRTVKRWLEG